MQHERIQSISEQIISKYLYLVLLVPIFIITYPILSPGLIISGDFPVLDTGEFASDKLSTWIANGSYPTVETLPRFPIIIFWYMLENVGIDVEAGGKAMIILGFSVASFSFYFSFVSLMRNRLDSYDIQLKIAAVIGSIIYAYNVWSFIRIGHWYLWIGYALLPLYLLSIVNSINRSHHMRWAYILLSVFLWSLASSTPHMAVLYGIIYIVIFLGCFLNSYIKRQSLYSVLVPFLSILALFILVNFYWLFPLFLSGARDDLSPPYVLTEEMGEILSRNSSMMNSLRLIADWTGMEKLQLPSYDPLYPIWVFSSFVVPIVAVVALLSKRMLAYSVTFLAILILGIILAMGDRSPLDYYSLIFVIPFGWLFRDPDKWSIFIALAYSFLVGIAVCALWPKPWCRERIKYVTSYGVIVIIIVCFSIYAYPIYDSSLGQDGKYSPVKVPSEFDRLNSYLSDINTDKIFFMPYPTGSTTWSNGHLVENVYPTFSLKPNIMVGSPGVSDPSIGNYYRYLAYIIMNSRSDSIGNLFYPFGTSYIIYHNDTDDSLFQDSHALLLDRLNRSAGVENLENIGFFKLFKVGGEFQETPQQTQVLGQNIVVVQGLDKLTSLSSISSFSSLNSSILFLDYPLEEKENVLQSKNILIPTKNVTDLVYSLVDDRYLISPYESTTHYSPSTTWSKAGTMDPLHGEFHTYLEKIGIENWDFDYGKGIVMTEAIGARIDVPFKLDKEGTYNIALRYLSNQKGGELRIFLDGKALYEIDTKDNRSNKFVWNDLDSKAYLAEGDHTLSLENAAGFNAVNVFTILPEDKKEETINKVYTELNETEIVYVLEGESNFFAEDQLSDASQHKSDLHVVPGFSGFSNGTVLVLPTRSEVSTELDVFKPSNYTLAVRLNQCESCLPLNIRVEDGYGNDINVPNNISIQEEMDSQSRMEWQYLNDIELHPGRYKFKVFSESLRDLDLVLLYSSDRNRTNTIDDLFVNPQAPAYMEESEMIHGTKYSVNISNATRPYTLSFAESFNPSWSAFVEDADGSSTRFKSLPLYTIQNGFYIDRLGNYTITIVNENDELFHLGFSISIITLVMFVITYFTLGVVIPRIFPHSSIRIFRKNRLIRE